MTTDVMQLPRGNRISAVRERGARLLQTRHVLRFDGVLFPDLTGKCARDEDQQTQPYALAFLLCMAAISLVRGVGVLLGNAFLEGWGVALDPFVRSFVLHMGATLVGIGMAGFFVKVTLDSTARRHMLLILLSATGIGLILAWLSHIVGYTDACHWPLVVVYLLWAWVEAVSNAQGQ
jgi:hypothetical protein